MEEAINILEKVKLNLEQFMHVENLENYEFLIKNIDEYIDQIINYYSSRENIHNFEEINKQILETKYWLTDPVIQYFINIDLDNDINTETDLVIKNLYNLQLLLSWINILFIKSFAKEIINNYTHIDETIEKNNTLHDSVEEIKEKISTSKKTMDDINIFKEKITTLHSESEEQIKHMKQNGSEINDLKGKSKSLTDEIIELNTKTKEITESLFKKEEKNKSISDQIEKYQTNIKQIFEKNHEQQKEIDNTIELANRHGMAGSFKKRKDELSIMQWTWIILFVVSIIVMFTFSLMNLLPLINKDKYLEFFTRLPFIGPLFWLAWYSIVQFGYTTKLVEDYSFKYATALAYEGYKNQIKADDTNNKFIPDLINVTIENFSKHPIRIYDKKPDTTPFFEIIEKVDSLSQSQIKELIKVLQKITE